MNQHCGWSTGRQLRVRIVFHWTDALSLTTTTITTQSPVNQHCGWSTGRQLRVRIVFHWTDALCLTTTTITTQSPVNQHCGWSTGRQLRVRIVFHWTDALASRHSDHQSVWMPKITNDDLTRSGRGCLIAVPTWHQWVQKGQVRFCVLSKNF